MNFQIGEDKNLLAGLNDAQREAVEHTEGPVLVLAGAGSGKTRVLTHRIAHIVQKGLVRPWQILAVTFTNKAAGELKERVAQITRGGKDVAAGTFHSTMLQVLHREAKTIGYPSDFSIFDADDTKRLVKQIMKDLDENDAFRPKAVHSKISMLKNDLIDPDTYAQSARLPFEKTVARVYPEYNKRLKVHGGMDFDDLITLPIKLFKNHPSVLNEWSSRWKYIHVDEMQDTNHAQFELLRLLAGPRPNLFAVGDDDQSIYGWRGAKVENIFQFRETFPGTTVFRLEQNYRSTQPILDLAHAVVERSVRREAKKLWTERGGGDKPIVEGAGNDLDEARQVVDRIGRKVMSGQRAFKDFAILYRTNAQSRLFEDALRAARYPYQVVGGVGFYSRKEIRDAIAYFRLCLNPRDNLSLRRIISEPPRGIGATTLQRLDSFGNQNELSLFESMERIDEVDGLGTRAVKLCKNFVEQIHDWKADLEKMPLEKWAKKVLEDSGYLGRLRDENDFEAHGRLDNLDSLITSFAEHAATGGTLADYLELAALATDQDKYDPGADSVRLMTIHAAKGLEFPCVFVTGLEEGTFPLQNQEEDDSHDLDEERRLFYVAVTRAHDELVLTYCSQRRVWGENQVKRPSTFLIELPKDGVEWDRVQERFASRPGLEAAQKRHQAQIALGQHHKQKQVEWPAGPGSFSSESSGESSRPASSAAAKRAINPDDIPAIRNGDLVKHDKFGQGIVLSVSPYQDSVRVMVEFDTGAKKTLIQKFARLQPVKDFD